ncbi:MAG: DUF4129 domain-containing protein [SAR202 cluster bacterium]|nr:DUF4129 domain-containing protein [SAR202 cluster bacterium]
MSLDRTQDRLVLVALVLAESCWLFALIGGATVLFNLDATSPLNYFAVVLILGASLLISKLAVVKSKAIETAYLLATLAGFGVIYLVISTQVAPGSIDLTWPVKMSRDTAPMGYPYRAAAGTLMGLYLWWRGGRIATVEFPTESLAFSFRLGLLILVTGAIIDLTLPVDLNTFWVVFVFFATALGGLAIGHLLPETEKAAESRTWPKVIAGMVAAILAVGVGIGLFQEGFLRTVSKPSQIALDVVVKILFWGVVAPIAFLFNLFTTGVINFFDAAFDPSVPEEQRRSLGQEAQQAFEDLQNQEEEISQSLVNVIQVVEWVFVTLVAVLILVLIAMALKRWLFGKPSATKGNRESVKEDASVLGDFARLLSGLIPGGLKKANKKGYNVPEGPDGIVEVYRIYYDLLTVAEEKGINREDAETPTEYAGKLTKLFPGSFVTNLTEAFNKAHYGNQPSSESVIERLRTALGNIKTAIGLMTADRRGYRRARPNAPRGLEGGDGFG